MAAVTDVTLTSGVPTGGTGTASTLDKFNGTAGSSTTQALTVQGIASGTAMPVTNAGTFATQAAGAVAAGATDSGNPVKIGGKYNSTLPTLTDGQRGDVQLDSRGGLMTVITDSNGSGAATVASASSNQLTNTNGLQTLSRVYLQFDDTSPGAITEDRLGIQRMSANRNAYTTLRDAAGNERGANVTASNALSVDTTIAGISPAFGSGANGATVIRTALATDSPGVMPGVTTDQAANYSAPALRTVPQEVHIGEVGGKSVLFSVTPTLDTSAYAAGDVLFDRTVMSNFFRVNDGTGVVNSLQILDKADNGVAIDFYIQRTNQTLGTANSAPSISDANAADLIGPFSVAAADYKDLGGCKVAKIPNLGQVVKAVSGGKDLYISGVVTSGTPTFGASDIVLQVGGLLD